MIGMLDGLCCTVAAFISWPLAHCTQQFCRVGCALVRKVAAVDKTIVGRWMLNYILCLPTVVTKLAGESLEQKLVFCSLCRYGMV
jgi:hypothetical protein